MQEEPTKTHHTESDMITLRLKVHRNNAAKVKEFVRAIEEGKERACNVAEVFPHLVSKDKVVALRAYRSREDLTQRELAENIEDPALIADCRQVDNAPAASLKWMNCRT